MNDELSRILKLYNMDRADLAESNDDQCECGEPELLCRGRKLGRKLGVDVEKDVRAFSACILAAREMDQSFFRELHCYFDGTPGD